MQLAFSQPHLPPSLPDARRPPAMAAHTRGPSSSSSSSFTSASRQGANSSSGHDRHPDSYCPGAAYEHSANHRQHLAPLLLSGSPPAGGAGRSAPLPLPSSGSGHAFSPASFPPPQDRSFFAQYSPSTAAGPHGSSPYRSQQTHHPHGRTPIPPGVYDRPLPPGMAAMSPSVSLPSISQFLSPRPPLAGARSSPAAAVRPPPRPFALPSSASSSASSSAFSPVVGSSRSNRRSQGSPGPPPPPSLLSPTKRRLGLVDPARLPLPPSPAGPSTYDRPAGQKLPPQPSGSTFDGAVSGGSPAKRRRHPPPSPVGGGTARLRQKPSLEAVLLPAHDSSLSAAAAEPVKLEAAPRQRQHDRSSSAAPRSAAGEEAPSAAIKIREGSVSSDGSSEFDILEPYISRAALVAVNGGPPTKAPLQAQVQQQTPLRASTSLPALLADLDSSSDDDGADSNEAFTPRRPLTDGPLAESSAGSGSGAPLRTPSSSSLLDSVLGAPGGSRSAHADEERRKWALIRRSGGGSSGGGGSGGADHVLNQQHQQQQVAFGRSPPTSLAGPPLGRSQSFPTQLAALSTPLALPARTPGRPYHHAGAVLTDPYAPPALDLSHRSPGAILTPYRSTTTAAAGTGGVQSGALAAAGERERPAGRGHRREPSRAETECYWQSSPSDSTAAATEEDDAKTHSTAQVSAEGHIEVSSGEPSDASASEDDLSDEDEDAIDDAVRRAFGPGSSSDPITLPASPPPALPPVSLPQLPPPPPHRAIPLVSISASLARSPAGLLAGGGSTFPPLQQQHRPLPIEPLLFHPYSATPTALPSVVGRPREPTSSSLDSASSLGRLVSAAATVERRSAAANEAEDGRSTSSDKENHSRPIAFGETDVFGHGAGAGGVKSSGLPSVIVAPPPASADSPANGADKSRSGRRKKALGGTASRTSPVIQECDLPPINLPTGPRSAAKPAFSYAAMIGQAIFAHPRQRLSLAEIYNWISGAYPFYRKGEAGWMNSIRHNLSLNKCFVKVEREKTRDGEAVVIGKGMLWAIEAGCEHQFEGGGFNKNGKTAPAAKGKAATTSRSSKSATPAGDATSKKRKAGGGALTESESERPSESPPPSELHPAKRLKLRVAINTSAPLSHYGAPSPAGSAQSYDSPEVNSHSLPSLAAAFVPRGGSSYPTLPMPRGMLHGARPPVSAASYELHAPEGGLGGTDDYATPQRPTSREPPPSGPTSVPSSSREMPPPASCLRGLPHLTPSVSSPASSSPAQPFVPRPQAVQAHQALLRSSLGQSESVSIVEDAQAYDDGLSSAAGVPAGLQPGFQIAKPSTSPKPSSASLVPASPTTSRFHSSVAPGIQSPMSSLRATANDDEVADHAPVGVAAPAHAWRPPTGNPAYYNFSATGVSHHSPLHNRKLGATNGGGGGDRARGLSATGELVNHAMRDPPPSAGATFKTPGMQPISASPRETLPRPWAYPGGPASPGSIDHLGGMPLTASSSRRGMILHASATPKGGSMLSYSSAPYGLTPARTPVSHPTQSPAGAALLQRRAELGMLGAELTYGDDDVVSTPGGGSSSGLRRSSVHALSGDPYDSSSAVEHELRHIGSASKILESPGGHAGWGGGGRTIATPVRPTGWINEPEPSPGFGLGSPGRVRYVFR